ncbi:tripartite tricarboxylate transporter substrate binding protein [Paenibacillus sp. TRM 82003]|nr:tripartite tricarboxylate transporter substrate binding protein [Paenibacillus sp. TRM 82003]
MREKRALLVSLVLMLCLFVAACGSPAATDEPSTAAPAAESSSASTTEPSPAESEPKIAYPEKPVKLVIPYPPGGGTDVLFRLVASYAEKHLGQTIVPVNMGGATATVGSREVKDAAADGYTILGTHQVVATAQHTGIVDYGFADFQPVAQVTSTPHIPMLSKAFAEEHNIKTITDFTEYVRNHPNTVIWAYTVGSEDHYTIAALLDKAGVDPKSMKYVSYPGTGPQYAAIVASQVNGMTGDFASGKGYIEAGNVVPLAVVDDERNPFLPDVPTLKEQGIDFTVTVDRGLLAPKGTPIEVVEVLNAAFESALADPELQQKIEELGSFPKFKAHGEYGDFLTELDETMGLLADKMKF